MAKNINIVSFPIKKVLITQDDGGLKMLVNYTAIDENGTPVYDSSVALMIDESYQPFVDQLLATISAAINKQEGNTQVENVNFAQPVVLEKKVNEDEVIQ